jgi:putative ATP-dependent endonuclease of OLD family
MDGCLAQKCLIRRVFPTIKAVEDELRALILHLSGKAHDIDAGLRFAPSDPLRLFR